MASPRDSFTLVEEYKMTKCLQESSFRGKQSAKILIHHPFH